MWPVPTSSVWGVQLASNPGFLPLPPKELDNPLFRDSNVYIFYKLTVWLLLAWAERSCCWRWWCSTDLRIFQSELALVICPNQFQVNVQRLIFFYHQWSYLYLTPWRVTEVHHSFKNWLGCFTFLYLKKYCMPMRSKTVQCNGVPTAPHCIQMTITKSCVLVWSAPH